MAIKTTQITSIATFITALTKAKQNSKQTLWFRGQSDASWPLLPGYLRLKSPPQETNLFNEFRQSAAMLADFTPTASFDWLMLMQHYGVPTRLLDWSENPMIAMYFALANRASHKGKDAAFWILQPSKLNKNAGIFDQNDENFIPSTEDEVPKTYTIEYLRNTPQTLLMPIATLAIRNNTRIQAQSGVFTIHHFENIPIEDVGKGDHVHKFIIPSNKKETIASQLETLGLNRFHVFPELATIGDLIKDRYK